MLVGCGSIPVILSSASAFKLQAQVVSFDRCICGRLCQLVQ